MRAKRHHPSVRQEMMLKAAIELASEPGGWVRMTREAIAHSVGCSDALVSRYLGDMKAIRRMVMYHAIRDKIVEIIAQSIASGDDNNVPLRLRNKAIKSLLR